jgi:predicted nucleic acid-binding protein
LTATAVDTSILIAALCSWHEHHDRALSALMEAEKDGELIVPAPALVEAYSVMTRLPSPHRLSPKDAKEILSRSFEKKATVVGLTGSETWRLIRDAEASGVAGGRIYDASILACARKGGADRLLTLDLKDFRRLEVDDIDLLAP